MAGRRAISKLFDYKPELAKWNGKTPPAELTKDYRAAFINPNAALLGPKFKFAKHGQSWRRDFRAFAPPRRGLDDIAIVKSLHTDAFNHAQPNPDEHGAQQLGRPSFGAWTTYASLRNPGPSFLRRLHHRRKKARAAVPPIGARAFCLQSIKA